MNELSRSYLKVPYDLRISKQIERRMMVDALQRLANVGFDIRKYQYTGMGSTYFVDFILLHRFLGMHNMLSVEMSDEIKKRVRFNRPFNCIRIRHGAIGDVIPELKEHRHILWMDFDGVISHDIVVDVVNAASTLASGSILLVTVDVEPPDENAKQAKWKKYYFEAVGDYCDPSWKMKDFAESNLINLNIRILEAAIKQGMAGRTAEKFQLLFNFSYADKHEMLTLGGMICNKEDEQLLNQADFSDAVYARFQLDKPPYRVPRITVTRKERLYLDSAMPRKKNWTPAAFELPATMVRDYSEVYRYLPTYAELLL